MEVPAQREIGRVDANIIESFRLWMIATRKRRKPNSSKENISDLNRNHEPIGVSASRFQILAQVSDEFVNLVHAAPKDIPSISYDHNTSHVNEVKNPHIHPAMPMSGVDGVGMSDNEDLMVQETPLALMTDVSDQQH
ncbi:hypothetical protein WN943_019464 [Citrus x changshan-huyou]